MNKVNCFFLMIFSLMLQPLQAASHGSSSSISITPLVGLERIQRVVPTASMKTRALLGVTVTYKLSIAMLEAQYTQGQDETTDSATQSVYKFEDKKYKLGLRGQAFLGPVLSAYIRGGGQLSQSTQTRSLASVTVTSSTSSSVNPYAGIGIAIHPSPFFALNFDLTAVYIPTDNPALDSYEIQPSLGLALRF